MEDSFFDITEKILDDPIYWAYKLGGIRFISQLLLDQNININIKGYFRCQACHYVYSNESFVDVLKSKFKGSRDVIKSNIGDEYKSFIMKNPVNSFL